MLYKNILKKSEMVAAMLGVVLCFGLLAGCGSGASNRNSGKTSVVATIFPAYDWASEIIGDNQEDYELTLLLDNGADLHSYQPTAKDMATIASCDVFIYVGGESETWVEDALKEAINQDMQVINLLEVLADSVKEEEIVEGMQDDADHAHSDEEEHDHEDEHDHEEEDHDHASEVEYDEHVWLSLKNAEKSATAIANALKTVHPEQEATLDANLVAYTEKLSNLDSQYTTMVQSATFQTLLFGDRFPFRYLVEDYDLDYYAAFPGCSAETEASFDTVVFLSGKMNELGLNSVLVLENSDEKIAQTIINNTTNKNQNILTMDSMQATTTKDAAAGKNYLSIMEANLQVLTEALN